LRLQQAGSNPFRQRLQARWRRRGSASQNDPNAKLVIVGFADAKEPRSAKVAATRADLAKAYLGEKGIDASRVSTRAGEASKEKGMEKENRRVDFVIVPEGATY